MWIRTTETTWWRTTETLLGAWFETCLTRHGDVLMGLCCYFLLRSHHDVECFIQDVPATSLGHTEGHSYDVAMTSCGRVDLHIKCLFICFDIYLSHYSLKFFQSSLKGFIFELRDVNFVDLYLRFDVNKDWCLQPNARNLRKSKFHRLRMVPQLSFLHYLLFF